MDTNWFDLISGGDFYEANIRMQDERDATDFLCLNSLNVRDMIRFYLTIGREIHNANGWITKITNRLFISKFHEYTMQGNGTLRSEPPKWDSSLSDICCINHFINIILGTNKSACQYHIRFCSVVTHQEQDMTCCPFIFTAPDRLSSQFRFNNVIK